MQPREKRRFVPAIIVAINFIGTCGRGSADPAQCAFFLFSTFLRFTQTVRVVLRDFQRNTVPGYTDSRFPCVRKDVAYINFGARHYFAGNLRLFLVAANIPGVT